MSPTPPSRTTFLCIYLHKDNQEDKTSHSTARRPASSPVTSTIPTAATTATERMDVCLGIQDEESIALRNPSGLLVSY
jgi:hypothetical protein